MSNDVATQATPPELTPEQEARNMGWKPKEEFSGNPDNWVDAEEFLDRGRHVLPILNENNKRLQKELAARDNQISQLQSAVQESQSSIKALQAHYNESTKRAVELAKKEVIAQLKAAKEGGDVETEVALTEQLQDLRDAERAAATAATSDDKPVDQPAQPLDPAFIAWQQDNPWFNTDLQKTQAILAIANGLRAAGNKQVGRPFMDACVKILDRNGEFEEPRAVSKVEGGGVSSSRTPGAKSFASLPAEAKAACRADARHLVGPNKAFKKMEDWEAEYARTYYGSE